MAKKSKKKSDEKARAPKKKPIKKADKGAPVDIENLPAGVTIVDNQLVLAVAESEVDWHGHDQSKFDRHENRHNFIYKDKKTHQKDVVPK